MKSLAFMMLLLVASFGTTFGYELNAWTNGEPAPKPPMLRFNVEGPLPLAEAEGPLPPANGPLPPAEAEGPLPPANGPLPPAAEPNAWSNGEPAPKPPMLQFNAEGPLPPAAEPNACQEPAPVPPVAEPSISPVTPPVRTSRKMKYHAHGNGF